MAIARLFITYFEKIKNFHPNIKLFLFAEFLIGIGMVFWRLLFNLYLKSAGFSDEEIGTVLIFANFPTCLYIVTLVKGSPKIPS